MRDPFLTYPVYNPPGDDVHLGIEDDDYREREVEGNYGGIELVDG